MTNAEHLPVLRHSAVDALAIKPDGRYIDGTYGRGGHSQSILSKLSEKGQLLALDRDPEAVADARQRFAGDNRFSIESTNFCDVDQVLERLGWVGSIDGMLLDLGVSSPQLDVAERGFGFSRDGDLDMRMDPLHGVSAADWLASVSEDDLVYVLRTYGEERYARRISAAIVAEREKMPITRTLQLAEIVKRAHPKWERHHHPATRSFQAIRIFVNGELDAISSVLDKAASMLTLHGRLVVISFHSLEDRLVKRAFRKPTASMHIPRHLPIPEDKHIHPWRALGKAVKASDDELAENSRARSAIMRIAERVI